MTLQIPKLWKQSFLPAKVRYLETLPTRSMRTKAFSSTAEGQAVAKETQKKKKLVMPDERIVISGISGRFPNSENLQEFRDNLKNGVDMVQTQTRWKSERVPPRYGLLKNLDKFDAGFFGIVPKLAEYMDPQQRKLLEVTFEAIIDAGLNPGDLKGKKVGVFVGALGGEAQDYQVLNGNADGALRYHTLGVPNFMLANRLSYNFDLRGTSIHVSTGCSASLMALEQAVAAITRGTCEAAIVAGSTVHLNARVSEPLVAVSALAPDGVCKAFDEAADGFVRGEAVVAILIQKESDALRNYAAIRHIESNSDGYKSEGLMFPSGKQQETLLRTTYENADIDPAAVSYIEAHGTGTPVGDPQEIQALYNVFCKDVPRESPLIVGSVKSNVGHAESAAGLVSIAKVLTSIQDGVIPANLNFNKPNSFVKHLFDEKLKVPQEAVPWKGGFIGINSFGLGGTNAHLVLEPGSPRVETPSLNLPILVPFSGRTEESVEESIRQATVLGENSPEFFALVQNAFRETIPGHNFRGYGLIRPGEPEEIIQVEAYENNGKRPLWFIFPGMGSQWNEMGLDLMKFPAYAESLIESSKVLKKVGVDLEELLKPSNGTIFSNIRDSLVSITAVQIALFDLLNSVGLRPDGFVGHSSGEILCAYADGCLTKEETLLVGNARGRAFHEAVKVPGGMAAVGLSWKDIKARCPPDIYPACHNAATNVSISGPQESIREFVAQLQNEGVFAREINSCNCAPHSKYVYPAHALLDKYMKEVYSDDRPRSERWISSSIPESDWGTPLAKYSSVQYHVNNMGKPVLFHEAIQHVPADAVVVEIAPRGLFQGLLKESLPNCVHIAPMNSTVEDKVSYFLNSIGRIHNAGVNVDVGELYPLVKFPVSSHTPSLSPLIKWNHEESRGTSVVDYPIRYGRMARYDINDQQHSFLNGHKLGSKIVFPATGYLSLAWNGLAELAGKHIENYPVTFENVSFERATFLNENNVTELKFSVLDGKGNFEIREDDMVVVKGIISHNESGLKTDLEKLEKLMEGQEKVLKLSKDDVYQELRLRGYNYEGAFQGIANIDTHGKAAQVEWTGNWTSFLDTVFQTGLFSMHTRNTIVPVRFQSITIDPKELFSFTNSAASVSHDEGVRVPVSINKHLNSITCPGVEVKGVSGMVIPPRRQEHNLAFQKYVFSPFMDSQPKESLTSALWEVIDTVKDNTKSVKISVTDIFNNKDNSLADVIHQGFSAKNFDIGNLSMITLESEAAKLGEETKTLGELVTKDQLESLKLDYPADLVALDDLTLLPGVASTSGENSFILLHDNKYPTDASSLGLKTISEFNVDGKNFTLLRKVNNEKLDIDHIQIGGEEFSWLPDLQAAMAKPTNPNSRLYVTSQNDPNSGIVGLVKSLRYEAGGEKVRGIFDPEGKLNLNFKNPDSTLSQVLEKDLFLNVYQDGQLGNYFHLPLNEKVEKNVPSKESEHAFVNTLTAGDLSSLRWIESPLSVAKQQVENDQNSSVLCKVSYAAMNFRDIMLASGKLPIDASATHQDCVMGFEFSGHDPAGNRVMGIVPSKGLATSVLANSEFLFKVPESWSLEDAATVPIVYSTAYYALFNRGRLTPGQSILIHAGTGGVGQAAISIAHENNCEIFTTVGTEEKRKYIKELFPFLKNENIGNSRDCSFEPQIMELTQGRGVDLVLNSLADEKLQASVRCLAMHGKFLEIGAFDAFINTPLGMSTFLKNTEFHGIFLNQIFSKPEWEKQLLKDNFRRGIESGVVRPLPRTVFKNDKIEEAFRFMAGGKHVGKVLIDVFNSENDLTGQSSNTEDKQQQQHVTAIPRTYFYPDKAYVVIGGLGGLGLEVANWLTERGARHLILPTRSGLKTGYQSLCVEKWESLGVKIDTPKIDLSDFSAAEEFIKTTEKDLKIGGIFNSSLVLKDGILETQTRENFELVAAPKVSITKNLDRLTREHCKELDHFVAFSSITSGRGNLGQANYGYANSVMERVCENRKADGLPALSIQWGVIGDVGYLGKMSQQLAKGKSFFGMMPQNISSCLDILDRSLQQSSPVCTSVVTLDKSQRSSKGGGLIASIMNMFGVKDIGKLNPSTKLTELGMDSLIGVELKQTLEREFDLPLTVNQMRALTVGDLKRIDAGLGLGKSDSGSGKGDNSNESAQVELPFKLYDKILVKLGSGGGGSPDSVPLFVVHGNFGGADNFEALAKKLHCDTYGFQYGTYSHLESIEDLAKAYIAELKLIQPEGPYNIAGYSGGGTIAFEIARILESEEYNDKVSNLVFLDGSCDWTPEKPDMKTIFSSVLAVAEAFGNFTEKEKADFRNSLGDNFEDNIRLWKEYYQKKMPTVNVDNLVDLSSVYIKYASLVFDYSPKVPFSGNVTLVRAFNKQFFKDDLYNIKKHCTGEISAHVVQGSHFTFLSEDFVKETSSILNEALSDKAEASSQSIKN